VWVDGAARPTCEEHFGVFQSQTGRGRSANLARGLKPVLASAPGIGYLFKDCTIYGYFIWNH